jgi:hypothetical protein
MVFPRGLSLWQSANYLTLAHWRASNKLRAPTKDFGDVIGATNGKVSHIVVFNEFDVVHFAFV